jgi:flagellar basal-body rod modification protein FlgD
MGAINGLTLPPVIQNSTSSQQSESGTGSSPTSNIDKSQFLQLLVTQLQNQDPLNPMDNTQFVTQLATFSSLEQLMSINQAVTKLAGGSGT